MENILGGLAFGLPLIYGYEFIYNYCSSYSDNKILVTMYSFILLGFVLFAVWFGFRISFYIIKKILYY